MYTEVYNAKEIYFAIRGERYAGDQRGGIEKAHQTLF
jgi:hypothetical protein